MENTILKKSFGKDTVIDYDSAEHGINPENEHIIIDTKIVSGQDGYKEKWVSIRRLDSVRVIAEKNGEIYFAKQTSNGEAFYTAFGGSVLHNETHEEAAKRELLEEAGMQGKMELLMQWKNPDTRLKWIWSIYIAHDVEMIASQQLDKMENIEVVKVKNFEEFTKIMANEHLKQNPNGIPFKDYNLLAIINNYIPINHAAIHAITDKINDKSK